MGELFAKKSTEFWAVKLLASLRRSLECAHCGLEDALIDPWMDLDWSMPEAAQLLVADAMEQLEDYAAVMALGEQRFGAQLAAEGRVAFAQQWQRAELERQLAALEREG